MTNLTGADDSDDVNVRQPARLEPSGRVTAARLIKFTDFIDQLRAWFSAHDGAALPEGSDELVRSLRISLAGAIQATEQLLGPAAATETVSEPLISGDLGPVAEVDMSARLELDNIASRPLLQIFRGVTELTPEAITMIDRVLRQAGDRTGGAREAPFP